MAHLCSCFALFTTSRKNNKFGLYACFFYISETISLNTVKTVKKLNSNSINFRRCKSNQRLLCDLKNVFAIADKYNTVRQGRTGAFAKNYRIYCLNKSEFDGFGAERELNETQRLICGSDVLQENDFITREPPINIC